MTVRPASVPFRGAPIPAPGLRAPRAGLSPALTVIVVSPLGGDALDRCLASIAPQCAGAGAELLVATASRDATMSVVLRRSPEATVMLLDGGTAAELRAAAMSRAAGDVVFLTDDVVDRAPGWLAAALPAAEPAVDPPPLLEAPATFAVPAPAPRPARPQPPPVRGLPQDDAPRPRP